MSSFRVSLHDTDPAQLAVLGFYNTPPAHLAGRRVVVGTAPTGAFNGHANKIAWSDGTNWWFDQPASGWETWSDADAGHYYYTGMAWVSRAAFVNGLSYWQESSGDIYYQAGRVGVGKIPEQTFDVKGTLRVTDDLDRSFMELLTAEGYSQSFQIFCRDLTTDQSLPGIAEFRMNAEEGIVMAHPGSVVDSYLNVGSGYVYGRGDTIQFAASDATVVALDQSSFAVFRNDGAPRIYVDINSGDIGIGKTNPAYKLDVVGAIQSTTGLYSDNLYPRTSAGVQIGSGTNPVSILSGKVYVNGTTGNVGIGTTSPNTKLVVTDGDISILGSALAGGRSLILQRTGATSQWKLIQGHTYTNAIEFLENGTSRLMIKEGGNVGIGTTSPVKKLEVFGDIALSNGGKIGQGNGWGTNGNTYNATLELYSGSTGYTTLQSATVYGLLLNPAGGNVGIGTTSPLALLHVSASGGVVASTLQVGKATDGINNSALISLANRGFISANGGNAESWNPTFAFNLAYGSNGFYTPLTTTGYGYRAISYGYNEGINFYASGANTTGGAVVTPTSVMRILNNGNVGIGTTSPSAKLDVYGNLRLRYDSSNYIELAVRPQGQLALDGTGTGIGVLRVLGGNYDSAGVAIYRIHSGDLAAGNIIGNYGFVPKSEDNPASARITAVASAAHGATSHPTALLFGNALGGQMGSTDQYRMMLDKNGNALFKTAGINITTTLPEAKSGVDIHDSVGYGPTAEVTGNTTLGDAYCYMLASSATGNATFTLPDRASIAGRNYMIVNGTAAYTITIARQGTDKANGGNPTIVLSSGDVVFIHATSNAQYGFFISGNVKR